MVLMDKPIILPLEEEDVEKYLPKGFLEKDKVYELGDSITVYEYYYPDDNTISMIYDYYNERIIITLGKVGEILSDIEDETLKVISIKHGEFNDEQLDYNYNIEVFYPDYWSAISDDHSVLYSKGYWDYLQIELYHPTSITSSLLKIEKVKVDIPVWVNIGVQGTKIISVNSDMILVTLAKLLGIHF